MAETFTPENIDPALCSSNPANDLLERIRNRTTQPSTPALPGDEEMEDSPLETPLNPSNTMDTARSLVNYSRLVKRKMDLSDAASVTFDQFCQTRSSEERQALFFAHILQLLELAKKSDKADLWKNVSSWVKAFVFGPSTISYCGLNKAMRERHVADLPEEDDIVAVNLLLASIWSKGTSQRNIYKTNVKKSMESRSTFRNVAVLSHRLIKGYQAYGSALPCWCLKQYPELNDEDFWPKVDETIAMFRKDQTQEQIDICFNTIYEDDKAAYGDPATADHKTVDDAIPDWQKTLRKHANKVQTTPAQKKHRIGEVDTSTKGEQEQ
ncbi:hypothetical protein DFH07DRAFT_773025 [Mycena maculata]|uniref:Uncharacterized protein n=1 Tax=Mycena maculata TaxID=230809 RepID=A0AAD7J7K2_9AGAR|nr:hypothetical protein DFH07DRAFT_773025 [Mycena maculata]